MVYIIHSRVAGMTTGEIPADREEPQSVPHTDSALLDSGFRRNDEAPVVTPAVIPALARLHGCTPASVQVVERRLEQAAEVVEPRLERRPRNPVVCVEPVCRKKENPGLLKVYPRQKPDYSPCSFHGNPFSSKKIKKNAFFSNLSLLIVLIMSIIFYPLRSLNAQTCFSMYICICNAVTDSDIDRAVRNGANCVRHLKTRLEAGVNCGACVCELERCLDKAIAGQPVELELAAC